MDKRIRIGLVGDFDEKIDTLVKLNEAIAHCRSQLNFSLEAVWVPTETIDNFFLEQHTFQGFWVTPGSPYKKDDGVYELIRWSRENNFPILGTCGGFQYMVVEYARNVLGFSSGGHQESEPLAEQLLVSKLSCSLRGQQEEIAISDPQSWLYKVLKTNKIIGHFNCSYGVNLYIRMCSINTRWSLLLSLRQANLARLN